MVIDNNKIDQIITSAILKRNFFAEEIFNFISAEEALRYLNSLINFPGTFPSVLFLDINMPVNNGFSFMEHYKDFPDELQKLCHVIMMSDVSSPDDFEQVSKYPAVKMIVSKPFSDRLLYDIHEDLESGVFHQKTIH